MKTANKKTQTESLTCATGGVYIKPRDMFPETKELRL